MALALVSLEMLGPQYKTDQTQFEGGSNTLAPFIVSEMSPPSIRGRLVGMYEIGVRKYSDDRSRGKIGGKVTDLVLRRRLLALEAVSYHRLA